ncbi:MAG: aldehyde dehydrogenase [Syntrophomonadaceae bacterium]
MCQIRNLIQKQRAFFQSGKTLNMDFRIQALAKIGKAIEKNEEKVLSALNQDLGKSPKESYMTELALVYGEIKHLQKNLHKYCRVTRVPTPLLQPGGKSFIIPEPLGLVLIIGPWNYPFQLIMLPLIGALAAGNCAVLKPSEFAPQTSALIKQLMADTIPEELVAVVEGGIKESQQLLQNRFDHIFFTGGTETGKKIMEAASLHLTPITLELGGKSPCIVDSDINLDIAARRIVWGKFLNAGQTCIAPDYLLIDKKVKDLLIPRLISTIIDFYGEEPLFSADYARIVNQKHFSRLVHLMAQGDIVWGGQYVEEERYISPTILTNVSSNGSLMQEEIFGPLLPVLEYTNLDDAIAFVNSRPQPLALYFFSRNQEKQNRILLETSSGGACINDTIIHIANRNLPFGGVGESGMGCYHGRASFATFTHYKGVFKSPWGFDLKIKYPPYNQPLSIIKKMLNWL